MTKIQRNGWLITGGTGFLGRALVRRLLAEPLYPIGNRICIYSRGEAAQAAMRAELKDDEHLRWFIGDVRDRERLQLAMESVQVVVHAAALKRVEVGLYNPGEMVKTNIHGAENVIAAALEAQVGIVVAVSTDKAVEPLNCYGATKLVAEKLFLAASGLAPQFTRFNAVRYGNVAGSTGSVIPTWRQALSAGRKITVRNPDATRFWITVDQAVDEVLKAVHAGNGSLLVPILPAYRLGDLALAMFENDADLKAVEIQEALDPEEKLHEALLSAHEPGGPRLSVDARRLTIPELREEIAKL